MLIESTSVVQQCTIVTVVMVNCGGAGHWQLPKVVVMVTMVLSEVKSHKNTHRFVYVITDFIISA